MYLGLLKPHPIQSQIPSNPLGTVKGINPPYTHTPYAALGNLHYQRDLTRYCIHACNADAMRKSWQQELWYSLEYTWPVLEQVTTNSNTSAAYTLLPYAQK